LLDRARNEKRKAALEAELACPPMPSGLSYLWAIFVRLSGRRGSSGSGPITYLEIDAFQRITGTRLNGWEIEMIEALDRCYLAEWHRAKASTD
jgi:hypothetical protein